jgi:hypothetical protein
LRRFHLIPSQNGTARLTGCLVVSSWRSAVLSAIAGTIPTAGSESSTSGLGVFVKFAISRANFRSQRPLNPAIPIPCSINDGKQRPNSDCDDQRVVYRPKSPKHQTHFGPVPATPPHRVVPLFS